MPSLSSEDWKTQTSPYLNQFTQPDSIIPDLSNPQSWNRFSYVKNNPIRYTDPSGHRDCPETPCKDTGGKPSDSGGSTGKSSENGSKVNGGTSPSTYLGNPIENWSIKNANKLGVPGENYPNRVINTGVSGEENIASARNALYKLIGNNEIVAEREIPRIKGGIIYELENGTTITFRPIASADSHFMPKIMINNEVDGTVINLIFYK